MIRIREMVERDHTDVSVVLAACYRWLAPREEWGPEQLAFVFSNRASMASIARESKSQTWLVACRDEAVVGVVAVKGHEIAKLYVHPDHLRKGIGSRLFREAERVLADGGFAGVVVGSNATSVGFYEAMGLSVVERRPCKAGALAGHEVAIMEKELGRGRTSTSGASIRRMT